MDDLLGPAVVSRAKVPARLSARRRTGVGVVVSAWSSALGIPVPEALVSDLTAVSSVEIVNAFTMWSEAVSAKAHGRKAADETALFPMDLWHWLEPDEKNAGALVVRRLAADHRRN